MEKLFRPGVMVEFIGNPVHVETLENGRKGGLRYTTGNIMHKGMTASIIDVLESPYEGVVLVDFGVCVRPLFPGPDHGRRMALHQGDYKLL